METKTNRSKHKNKAADEDPRNLFFSLFHCFISVWPSEKKKLKIHWSVHQILLSEPKIMSHCKLKQLIHKSSPRSPIECEKIPPDIFQTPVSFNIFVFWSKLCCLKIIKSHQHSFPHLKIQNLWMCNLKFGHKTPPTSLKHSLCFYVSLVDFTL